MKIAFVPLLFLLISPLSSAQTPPAAPSTVAPTTVVAEVDGKKYTAAEVDQLLAGLPPQVQAAFKRDPKQGLGYILMVRHLAREAEKHKLDQQSPLKEALEYGRDSLLSQAEINQVRNVDVNVEPADQEKYYKEHLDRFQDAKVRVIYVAFSSSRPEADAKTKIEGLRKQIVDGADFGKVARENSDDKESAAKDGDFGIIQRGSPYPESIKNAVFSLKPGQVSEPIREKNGFYLLRLESVALKPYNDVRTQIFDELKQKGFDTWMRATQKRYEVKIEDPAYFKPAPAK
jgi:peptidyl-prolyl cis-trans isomerase C